ncbi:hypothetical protein RIF29_42396 [Crotalaria pallida]|uniref:TSL-kinase interacting protein 1 n=1 Tax=Crotalaria pallida TaxID=3830 RepID=A0AAN9E6V8_CROPI
MGKKRKSVATRLDEVDRTMYSTFCSTANSLSHLYTHAMNQQKLSFQAGERHALEKMYQWILRQQQEGLRVNTTDIVAQLQNELEYGTEEPPMSPRQPFQQQNSQTALHNNIAASIPSNAFSTNVVPGMRNGQPDQQAKNSVFSNALSSPIRRNLQLYHLAQGSCPLNNLMPSGNGTRNSEMSNPSGGQNRDSNSSNSSDCMDMHADSPGHGDSSEFRKLSTFIIPALTVPSLSSLSLSLSLSAILRFSSVFSSLHPLLLQGRCIMKASQDSKAAKASRKCSQKTGSTAVKNCTKRTKRVNHKPRGCGEELLADKENQHFPCKESVRLCPELPDKDTFLVEKREALELHSRQTVTSSAKIKLQLFPINKETRISLEKDGHNPFLELTLRGQKKISSVLKHLEKKWGSSSIAKGNPMLFPYNIMENLCDCMRWTVNDSHTTAASVYAAVGNPAIFQLKYGWFYIHEPQSFHIPSTPISKEPCVHSGGTEVGCNATLETSYAERDKVEFTSKEFKVMGDAANDVAGQKMANASVDPLDNEPRNPYRAVSAGDLRTSILDAEETCHAFPLRKLSSPAVTVSGNSNSVACSLDASSNSLKLPNTDKVTDQDGMSQNPPSGKTQTGLSLSSCLHDDEKSLGLTDIKWNDNTLGPFDLACQAKKLSGGDSASIGGFVK